ncbi:hypothetical protein BH11ARM2_BH11ARM2_14150 [soil metagenome]
MNAFIMLSLLATLALAPLSVTKIRIFPAPGATMKGGRFTGSNAGPTTDFDTLAEIKAEPKPGGWTEIEVPHGPIYRYLKYEGTWNTSAAVGEVEFWAGDVRLKGMPFSTVPADGKEPGAAFDGDPATVFQGKEGNGQYVGIDLGEGVQAAAPMLSIAPGSYPGAIRVTAASATPGATLRYSLDGATPQEDWGDVYKDGIDVPKSGVLVIRAFRPDLAGSVATVAPYRIGATGDGKTIRTFHIGNSLTDTVVPWMEPLAAAGGHSLEFHRFTIPGAPTDWLWDHPASGFGDSRYTEAFAAYAPIDDIFTQPFAGHGRDIANEADYSARFFDAARKNSPNVQAWLYVQWPTAKLDDRWSKGEGDVATLPRIHHPAQTFAEAVENHRLYTEAVRALINATYKGKPVAIVPAGPALAALKAKIDSGGVPGFTDLFKDLFADDLHLNPKGQYFVSLVHYACLYHESPVGRFGPLNSGLTPEQARIFQAIAWDAVARYPLARPATH